MNKQAKIETVNQLTETLKSAKSLVVADYRGLKVAQMAELRQSVNKAGGQLLVIKNRLLARALEQAGLPAFDQNTLTGPTILAIALEDEIAPIKALDSYIKTNSLPVYKAGIWEKQTINADEIKKIAGLPSKIELIGKLLSILNFPARSLLYVFNTNQQKLVYLLNVKSKGGEKLG